MSSLDIANFKEVVGHYATGVVVITAHAPEGPVGFTCQTFGSLSLDPVLVSFAARSSSNSWPKVREVGAVGINILSSGQEALARVFATSGIDKFEGVGWTRGPNGTPLLSGALAHLEGRIVAESTYGDHDIARRRSRLRTHPHRFTTRVLPRRIRLSRIVTSISLRFQWCNG